MGGVLMNDKLLHAICGALIGVLFMHVAGAMWAAGAVLVAGVGKEIFDYFRHGKPDVWDAIATFAGGGVVIAIGLLV